MSRDRELFGEEGKPFETAGENHIQAPPGTRAEGVATGTSDDDDIIELVDVAREGEPLSDFEEEGVSMPVDEEEPPEGKEDFLARQDEDLDDLSLPLDDTGEKGIDTDLMLTDELDDRLDSPDFDFESPEDLDEPAMKEAVSDISEDDLDLAMADFGDELEVETPEPGKKDETLPPPISQERLEPVVTETVTEVVEREAVSDISEDDLDLAMADFGDELEVETPEPGKKDETLPPPISQERLEAIVTETVTEVVERVVRETVAEVAERVIKEAIESLRESLDTPPE